MIVAYHVLISEQNILVESALAMIKNDHHGAIDIFVGVVRNHHQGQIVTGITYDVHILLAKGVLATICQEAEKKWQGTNYYVAHYHGYLPVGGISVLIAVSAPHRTDSFDACRYVIEEIKKRAPVWKREHYPDGSSTWLPGHSLHQGLGNG